MAASSSGQQPSPARSRRERAEASPGGNRRTPRAKGDSGAGGGHRWRGAKWGSRGSDEQASPSPGPLRQSVPRNGPASVQGRRRDAHTALSGLRDPADPCSSPRTSSHSSSLRDSCQRLAHPSVLSPQPPARLPAHPQPPPAFQPGCRRSVQAHGPQSYQSSSPAAADADAAMSSPAHGGTGNALGRKVKGAGGRRAACSRLQATADSGSSVGPTG